MNERKWVRYGLCNNIVLIRTEVRYDAINKHFTILLEDRRVESAYITAFETENKTIVPMYWFGNSVDVRNLFQTKESCSYDILYKNENTRDEKRYESIEDSGHKAMVIVLLADGRLRDTFIEFPSLK